MPRLASPAASENEHDISRSLLTGTSNHSGDDFNEDPPTVANNGELAVDLQDDSSDDEAFIAAQQAGANRKASNVKGRSVKKGGGFQSMGLNAPLLKAIARKGFSVPTPIQRKAIPLVLDQQDVVGMARTGSGKTAAFVIPMVQRLKTHSAKVGARAAVLSPSRELALQTLKVVKELGKGTDLRTVLLVGGDSIDDQFAAVTSNPDIIIATPGRFLHLKVEMGLDLSSIQYIVFDEADRLFELGFAAQLTEILHGLPNSRQTLLFSATLPKSLVEFARAGLQDPKLVRLDAEGKVSPDLESAFFTIKSADKEGSLLYILEHVIKVPFSALKESQSAAQAPLNRRKRKGLQGTSSGFEPPTNHSTIVFAATKHHVDYLTTLLRLSGYAVSYVYGSLDQLARRMQVDAFQHGATNILVVTDVAARGIDIPILANVINYDFPSQPKVFVHRVGRTARAGRKGWSYSLVRDADIPYMLDLQLFLSRRMVLGRTAIGEFSYAEDFVVGGLPSDRVGQANEWVTKLLEESDDLAGLRSVAHKGEKLYMRTRNSASAESAKRARDMLASSHLAELNMLFNDDGDRSRLEREHMLARLSGFRPLETIFEIGKRGTGHETAELIRKTREKLEPRRVQTGKQSLSGEEESFSPDCKARGDQEDVRMDSDNLGVADLESASEGELEVTFSQPSGKKKSRESKSWQDAEHFISYTPRESNAVEERGYGVHSGTNSNSSKAAEFLLQARGAMMELTNDESKGFAEPTRAQGMRWDKKSKKYVSRANDEDGSRGTRLVRGESGQKIAASFRSGRFDVWKKTNKVGRLPRVGELESTGRQAKTDSSGKQYRHRLEKAPKEADKYRDDYHKRKKRVEEAKEKRIGKFRDGAGRSELRSIDDMRKQRKLKDRRREKNARPNKKRRV